MHARQRLRWLARRAAREAHRAASALGAAGRRLAERLAYRPREVAVVALLAGGLFGGLAVERWRARLPAVAERLEAEPPRLTSPAPVRPPPRPRLRRVVARCEEDDARRGAPGRADPGRARPRLDLNRATPAELARAARISWRLAARIVAARDAIEGRAPDRPDPPPLDDGSAGDPPPAADTPGPDPLDPAPELE